MVKDTYHIVLFVDLLIIGYFAGGASTPSSRCICIDDHFNLPIVEFSASHRKIPKS